MIQGLFILGAPRFHCGGKSIRMTLEFSLRRPNYDFFSIRRDIEVSDEKLLWAAPNQHGDGAFRRVYSGLKGARGRELHDQVGLSEKFIAALLVRKYRSGRGSLRQFFNHSEERLAPVLLKLARLREHDVVLDAKIPL
jgi:hypothetical protein